MLAILGKQLVIGFAPIAALMGAGCAASFSGADQKLNPNKIVEVDLTGDLAISSGEPQICIDPQNPLHIATIEYGHGSLLFPVYELGPSRQEIERDRAASNGGTDGDISISNDGGRTWKKLPRPDPVAVPPLMNTPFKRKGAADPMIACGPNGALYVAEELDPWSRPAGRPGFPFDTPDVEPAIAASSDFGKTWSAPFIIPTPSDRPWLTVDQSTGKVYSVSSGYLDFVAHNHNIPGANAIFDRWLVAYSPLLKSYSAPRRLGGPDFLGAAGNTIAAAHGIIAATFVIGPSMSTSGNPSSTLGDHETCAGLSYDVCHIENVLGEAPHVVLNGRYISPPAPNAHFVDSTAGDIPGSLRSAVPPEISKCSREQPCLFMETSSDDGQNWVRHYVPVPGGFSPGGAHLAVDAGHAGRYAIGLLSSDRSKLRIVVTDDSGVTWSAPSEIAETAKGIDFKEWMAYGPTGVLGFMWKKQRDDMQPESTEVIHTGYDWIDTPTPGFDIYNSISCDGGFRWESPVKVNAKTSPGGISRNDDLSYIALDGTASHLVWGDRRILPQVHNVPGAYGGTHAFYGRVPFSVVNGGNKCGR